MNIMTKQGSQDNVITYEHFCDTKADLANIPQNQTTLGSTAIVLQDTNGMGIYIANSNKEWIEFSSVGSSSNNAEDEDIIKIKWDHNLILNEPLEFTNSNSFEILYITGKIHQFENIADNTQYSAMKVLLNNQQYILPVTRVSDSNLYTIEGGFSDHENSITCSIEFGQIEDNETGTSTQGIASIVITDYTSTYQLGDIVNISIWLGTFLDSE